MRHRLKLLLLKLRIYKIFKFISPIVDKATHFIKLCDWILAHKHLELNDFPANKPEYKSRYRIFEYVLLNKIKENPIDYFEFGVADGETFNWWLKEHTHDDSRFYGFDTFTGLPERWGIFPKGSFDMEGKLPALTDLRAHFYKGLFQESLQKFLLNYNNTNRKVIVMDADLYSSTLYVLATLAPYLRSNDIIIFDEFFAPQHEFLAFSNFSKSFTHIKLTPFAAMNNYSFVAFVVNI